MSSVRSLAPRPTLLLLQLLLAVCVAVSPAFAQKENASLSREMEKTISYQGGFTGSQAVDLGDLSAGAKIELLLSVVNNSGDAFEVKDVRGSCSCTKAEFNRGKVEANAPLKLRVLLTVPTQANREARAVPVYVDLANSGELQLTLRFRIDNLACFQNQTMLFQVKHGESMEKIRIPLVLSKSVDRTDLKLRSTGDFENGSFHLEEVDGTHYAVSDFELEEFPLGGFSGQLFLDNSVTVSTDDIRILVRMLSELEFSPEILTFTPKSASTWKSMGILRLQLKSETKDDSQVLASQDEAAIEISAELSHCKVTVEAVPIAPDLYRLKFDVIPDEELVDVASLPTKLTMKVRSFEKAFVVQRSVRWMNQ